MTAKERLHHVLEEIFLYLWESSG